MDNEAFYFKIGEMAEMFGITVKTLRLYEKMGLFTPAYKAPDSGYRYYSTEQANRLNTVISLKRVGFSLLDIKRMLDAKVSGAELSRLLQLKKAEIQEKYDTLAYTIEALDGMIHAAECECAKERLTSHEKTHVMSKVACLENIKFDNFITTIFWL